MRSSVFAKRPLRSTSNLPTPCTASLTATAAALLATVVVGGEPEMRYMVGSAIVQGAPGAEKGYYARTSKSSAVYEISDFDYQSINVKPDDMKQK